MKRIFQYLSFAKWRHRAPGLMLLVACSSLPHAAEVKSEKRMLIFYPEIREPFSKIFTDMVDGVEQCFNGIVLRYPLPVDSGKMAIESRIKQGNVDVLVALGHRPYHEIATYQDSYPVVLGALKPIKSPEIVGIAQIPSVEKILEKLSLITTNIKKISVVYSPEKNQRLINETRDLLNNNQIELLAYPVSSLQESAIAFQQSLSDSGQGDAIWLMNNQSILDKALLKEILEQAWKKKLIVFSSRPGLEKRGAAFSIYPDSHLFGQRLGQFVNQFRGYPKVCNGVDFDEVNVGINDRTLEHLGLTLNRSQRDRLNLVHPSN